VNALLLAGYTNLPNVKSKIIKQISKRHIMSKNGWICNQKAWMLVLQKCIGGRRGRDRMVVGFTTTYVVSLNLDQGEVYTIMW